jgi:hypothetical protein
MKRKHKDSGMRCAVAHFDKDGVLQPGCMVCSYCNEYIPFGKYEDECDLDPDQEWKTCDHKWSVRSWANPEFSKNAKQNERCDVCHAKRFGLPALMNGAHPNEFKWTVLSPETKEIGEE